MPTELREAKIKVVLDLSESEKVAEGLEEKTKRTKKEQDKIGRDEGAPGKGKPGKKISVRKMSFGTLQTTVRNVVESLPLFIGTAFAVGIGTAELNERFGPGMEALLKELMPEQFRKFLRDEDVDVQASAEMARWWSEAKGYMMSLTSAHQKATAVFSAVGLTGGTVKPGEVWDELVIQQAMAEMESRIEKTRRRVMQIRSGAAVGESMRKAVDAAGRPGVGK